LECSHGGCGFWRPVVNGSGRRVAVDNMFLNAFAGMGL
jgi:hypothetical protein